MNKVFTKGLHVNKKSEVFVNFAERLENLRKIKALTVGEVLQLVDLSPPMLSMIKKGQRNPSVKLLRRLAEAEGAASLQGSGTTHSVVVRPSESDATPWAKSGLQVQMVKVYGYAQALSKRAHKGDLIPDDVEALDQIPVVGGRGWVGFRVEGDSMAPTIRDGMIAVADPAAELVPRCVVVAKWDGILTIKRYRRIKDTLYLSSDNPAAGEDYEVPAKDMDWCLRVVRFSGEL